VRSNDADEFAGRNDLGILPELGKMLCVARDQVVGPSSIRALHELVVVGIFRNLQDTHGFDQVRAFRQQLEELLPKSFADFEFWPRENFAVLRKNGVSDIQPGWSGHCQQKPVRCSPSGFRAADTTMFVSMTNRSAIIDAPTVVRGSP
jgi:hypothetical protein